MTQKKKVYVAFSSVHDENDSSNTNDAILTTKTSYSTKEKQLLVNSYKRPSVNKIESGRTTIKRTVGKKRKSCPERRSRVDTHALGTVRDATSESSRDDFVVADRKVWRRGGG